MKNTSNLPRGPRSVFSRRGFRSTRGFTMLEILAVVAIIAAVIGAIVYNQRGGLKRGQIGSIPAVVQSLSTACGDYLQKPGSAGLMPITETTTASLIPVTGATFSAATVTALSNGCRLDTVLLTEGVLTQPINVKIGSQTLPTNSGAADVLWDTTLQKFKMNPDAAPTRDYSGVTRLECSISTTTAPSTANGSNFRLDGTNDLPANTRVVFLVIPNVAAQDAYDLAVSMSNGATVATAGSLNNAGKVAYAAAVNGLTTVYVYINHN